MGNDVHIPFAKSLHQGSDAKMLPDGVLSDVRNMRLRKDGKLESRYGILSQAAAPAAVGATSSRQFVFGDQLVSVVARADSETPAYTVVQADSSTWVTNANTAPSGTSATTLGSLYAGVRRRKVADLSQNILPWSSDCTIDPGGNLWVAVAGNSGAGFLYKFDTNGTLLFSTQLSASMENARILMCGAYVIVVFTDDGSTIKQSSTIWDLPSFTLSTRTVVATGIATSGNYFDVAPLSGTQYLLAYQSAASPTPTVSICPVYLTGTIAAAIATQALGATGGRMYRMSLAVHPTADKVGLVATEYTAATYVVSAGTWTKAGVAVDAWAVVDALGYATGYPIAGVGTGNDLVYLVNSHNTVTGEKYCTARKFPSTVCAFADNAWAVSRPAPILNGVQWWAVDCTSSSAVTSTYYLYGTRGSSSVTTCTCDAVACQNDAVPSTTPPQWEPRRNIVALGANQTVALPVYTSPTVKGVDVVQVEPAVNNSSLPTNDNRWVTINNQAILPGAIVREWSGTQLVESGLRDGPKRLTYVAASLGNVDIGAHQWIAVWEWLDEQGRVHRSPPSAPVSHTVLGTTEQVQLTVDCPPCSSKGVSYGTTQIGIVASIYRTQVNGSVFYLVGTVSAPVNVTQDVTFLDNKSDATIATAPVLYTQGARGALSGLLPNDPPPPARYACASASRVLLGGLEDPTEVRWSQLVYPGEPMRWSIDPAFRAYVEGEVTGVAVLDGTWIVFTRESIWEIVGDGPDDTGNGAFAEPRRRPSATGCISHNSIVETPEGVMFQGTNGGLWLLPRGGNAPVWVGFPLRDETSHGQIVTSAVRVDEENCVYFAFPAVPGHASFLAVYDSRNSEWYLDSLSLSFNGLRLAEWAGVLTVDGVAKQTPGSYYDSGATNGAISCSVTTGDIRPFGAGGWGRCRLFHLLGEFGSTYSGGAYVGLTAQISYDSGKTWTDSYAFSLQGTVGSAVNVQLGPSQVRGTPYRLKLTAVPLAGSAGISLSAFSMDLFKSPGVRRVAAAQRG